MFISDLTTRISAKFITKEIFALKGVLSYSFYNKSLLRDLIAPFCVYFKIRMHGFLGLGLYANVLPKFIKKTERLQGVQFIHLQVTSP